MSRILKVLSVVSMVSLACVLAACGDSPGPGRPSATSGAIARPKNTAAVPVIVAKVRRSSIPVELHAIGTGRAFKTVSVESQAAGIVKQVHYLPGQYVKRGDLLVTLDDSPFVAALQQAQATLARDQAQAKLDQVQLRRYKELFQQGIVAREQYDQYLATDSSARATVAADEAAIETAKIHLSYCSIYAPISGVTGVQLVYPGAAVAANGAPVLVVINQVSPLFVEFSVPQQYLGRIKRSMFRSHLPVQATPPGSSTPENGYLTFVDNTVNTTTGTIELMGTFANPDHRLWPGQYSNIVLRLGEQQNVLIVPSQAIQAGQQGDFVFVVKPDMTVAVRRVKTGQTAENETEIVQGLEPGETVVTDGQVRLVPGTKVYFTKGL